MPTTTLSTPSYCEVQLLSWRKKQQQRYLKCYLWKVVWEHTEEQLGFQAKMPYSTDQPQTFLSFSFPNQPNLDRKALATFLALRRTVNTDQLRHIYITKVVYLYIWVVTYYRGKRNATCSQWNHQCSSDICSTDNLQTAKGWQLFQENQGIYLHLHQTLSLQEHHGYL